jgi:hypothetical protein
MKQVTPAHMAAAIYCRQAHGVAGDGPPPQSEAAPHDSRRAASSLPSSCVTVPRLETPPSALSLLYRIT